MRFGILGTTQMLLDDGREIPVGGPRLRALLALLLLDAGRVVSAERLIDGLYGDRPPRGAANALQSQVSRLRQALPAAVEFHPGGYRLAVDPDDVDAHRFERLARTGERALAGGDPTRAAAVLREALELWRGPALTDVTDAAFAGPQSARLNERRLAAVEDRVEAELALGGHAALVAELRELVAAHPLRERLRGQLMRALAGTGRQAEALAEFADARRALAEELGADPSAALAAIHLDLLRGSPARPAVAGSGLPSQLTTFVGREEELKRVGELLGERRLVTLTGPGGAGKTRLAIEAAGRVGGEVCLVELAGLTDGGDVPLAVLSALGLRDAGLRDAGPRAPAEPGRDPTDRLVAALAERRLLLVLDNCEHVVSDAARLVARLLSAGPALRVLATSREPLGLTGEALCPVTGLTLPPPDCAATDALGYLDAPGCAAVRLFADRGADVAPGFAVTPDNIEVVLRICRTLDGLPLAIELAAARLRALPVAEVAARLDDRFRLLSLGSRAAPPRHRTLRAVVEWSWDLLDGAERTVARRLTVFAGGGTLEAAERVCGIPAADLVDAVTGLADKSLVEVDGGRYRMLDTVRAFGAERLAEAGEADELRRAHAAYYLDLARTADGHLRRAEQLEWLRRLDADRDNLHAALRRAIGAGATATALRLVAAMSFYWWLRGMRGEGARLAADVLDVIGSEPSPDLGEEYALCVLNASLGGTLGGTVDSPATGWVLPLVLSMNQPPRQPFLFYLAGMESGPPADGETLDEMMRWTQGLVHRDPWSSALTTVGQGMTWMMRGEFERAGPAVAAALAGFRAIGDRWGTMVALAAAADIAGLTGDCAGAIASMDEALHLAEELGSTVDVADMLRTRGEIRLRAGDTGGAEADFAHALALAQRAGAPEFVAGATLGLGEIALLRGDLAEARRLCEAALAGGLSGWFIGESTRSEIVGALARIAEAEQAAGGDQRPSAGGA